LKSLNLSDNQLSELPEDVFYDLKQLNDLDLSRNRLRELPNGLLAELHNIQDFKASENEIIHLPVVFWGDNVILSPEMHGNVRLNLDGTSQILLGEQLTEGVILNKLNREYTQDVQGLEQTMEYLTCALERPWVEFSLGGVQRLSILRDRAEEAKKKSEEKALTVKKELDSVGYTDSSDVICSFLGLRR